MADSSGVRIAPIGGDSGRAIQRRSHFSAHFALALSAFPILIFLILPTAVVIPMALTPKRYLEFPPEGLSLHSFGDVVNDPAWTGAAVTSLKVAAVAVLVAVVAGTSASIALHDHHFRGKQVVIGLVIAPIATPLIVLALAYYQFFAGLHLVGSFVAIALAHGVIATPYVYLTVATSLGALNPNVVRSARSLGARNLGVLRHVYLPIIAPGLLAGAVFAFTVSFDEAVIAFFLQSTDATTLPVKMFTDIQYRLSPKIAAVASLLVALASAALLVQVGLIIRRQAQGRRSVQEAVVEAVG